MLQTTSIDPKAVTSFIGSLTSNAASQQFRSSEGMAAILLELQGASLQLNIFHCSAAIKAFHYADGWSHALDFVSKMKTWAVAPDDLVLAAAVHSFEKSNGSSTSDRWATAITFLQQKQWKTDGEPCGDRHWATVQLNPAIGVCSNCGEWQVAASMLLWASYVRATLDAISYNSASNSFASGMWLQSVALLRMRHVRSVRSDVITFNSTSNALGQMAWAKGLLLLELIKRKGLQMNETSCGAAVKVCASKWQIATNLIQVVRSGSLRMNAVLGHSIVGACGMCNQWASSLQHISRLQADDTFDCKALVASIHAVLKARRWSLPLSLLWIHNRDCHHLGCVPTNAALAACGEGNAWATVLKLVQTIAESALVPDEVSWGAAVSSFEQVARWQHSLHFLTRTHSSKARTSDICCNSAASSCEKACNWQGALSVIHGMRQLEGRPGSIGVNAAITACQNVRAWQWSLFFMVQLHLQQIATEVSCSEAAIAAAQASSWPLSLVLLQLWDGGGAWATSMGSAIEASGPKQRLQLLAKLGSSSVVSLSLEK